MVFSDDEEEKTYSVKELREILFREKAKDEAEFNDRVNKLMDMRLKVLEEKTTLGTTSASLS